MTDHTTMELGLRIGDLEAENAKLRAEIDNLIDKKSSPSVIDILGPEAFAHMVEMYPTFHENSRRTLPSDRASEVLWSCVRMAKHFEERLEDATFRSIEASSTYGDLCADYERATKALAEYAMRAVEECQQ
jgi:hypothetical protein